MSINTSRFNTLIKNDVYFKASLDTLRLKKCNILTQEAWFSDLSSMKIKSLLQQEIEKMFFVQIDEKWEKECLGHEYKVSGRQKNIKKAEKKAKKAEKDYKQKPTVISHSVKWGLRGSNDPFVYFKYIDNCSDCNCPSKKISTKEKISLKEAISKAEEKLQLPSEDFYKILLQYVLKADGKIV